MGAKLQKNNDNKKSFLLIYPKRLFSYQQLSSIIYPTDHYEKQYTSYI